MVIEKQEIPESRVNDTLGRMNEAWKKITETDQAIYRKMSEEALKELKERIRRGEPPGEGMEHIGEYLGALDEYLSRGNI